MLSAIIPQDARRVVVVGTTGSGKTTFAKRLARELDAAHIELDALHWEPGWREAEIDVFRARADAATSASERWVVDGNYSQVRDFTWGRADTLVWLDYPFPRIVWRLFWRCLRRGVRQEELWNGNRERLSSNFLSRDSLFLWAIKTHWVRRRTYPAALATDEYGHLRVLRLRRPAGFAESKRQRAKSKSAPHDTLSS